MDFLCSLDSYGFLFSGCTVFLDAPSIFTWVEGSGESREGWWESSREDSFISFFQQFILEKALICLYLKKILSIPPALPPRENPESATGRRRPYHVTEGSGFRISAGLWVFQGYQADF